VGKREHAQKKASESVSGRVREGGSPRDGEVARRRARESGSAKFRARERERDTMSGTESEMDRTIARNDARARKIATKRDTERQT